MSDDRPIDSEVVNCLNNTIGKEHIGIYCTDKNGNCTIFIKLTDLVDFINRQQAEIEKLNKARQKQAVFLGEEREQKYELIDKLSKANTEIERLNKVSEICGECHKKYAEKIARAKSEAIKAYKERVKQELIAKGLYLVVVKNVLEEAEKEMAGDRDEGNGTADDSAADMRGVAYVDGDGECDSVDRGGG